MLSTVSVRVVGVVLLSVFVLSGRGGPVWIETTLSPQVAPVAVIGYVTNAQRLRLCVDRWNQGRMVLWGPTLASVSLRSRCAVTMAYWYERMPQLGKKLECGGGAARPFPGHPTLCLDRTFSFICVLDRFGAYACPSHVNSGALKHKNATVDRTGHLILDKPLAGTTATPLLPWQRRYTYREGYIYPWTSAGTLRQGLTLFGHRHANCDPSSMQAGGTALRCSINSGSLLVDPCYPQRAAWARGGGVAACPTAPGATTFERLKISRY